MPHDGTPPSLLLVTWCVHMPVGGCERAFLAAAADDGLDLIRARVPWLNQRGHLGLPESLTAARGAMATIFEDLLGDFDDQASKRLTPLPGDFLHEPSGTFIEIDESQHFTSWRLRSLDLYPATTGLAFDIDGYRDLCPEWAPRSDKYRASKSARGFGKGGRQRQRAYHDALRDLIVPAIGHPPVVRVAAADRDGAAAYGRARDQLSPLRS